MELNWHSFGLTYNKNKKMKASLLATVISVFVLTSFTKDNRTVAPNFTLQSMEGTMVSLSSFKGKVVYIDVWATWCRPCLMEMPYSKKLKERFTSTDNIVFLYVSIDNGDNIAGWKDMVQKKEISGVHLISRGGMEEKLLERYGIATIPRFIMIDKQGNIAQYNATPPSDPATYETLKKLLSE
jgi:thiol-disulfide isomerase/thioredoxin